jgi:hypothetical protein
MQTLDNIGDYLEPFTFSQKRITVDRRLLRSSKHQGGMYVVLHLRLSNGRIPYMEMILTEKAIYLDQIINGFIVRKLYVGLYTPECQGSCCVFAPYR